MIELDSKERVGRKKQGNTMFFASFLFPWIATGRPVTVLRCAALRCALAAVLLLQAANPVCAPSAEWSMIPYKGLISFVQAQCMTVGDWGLSEIVSAR